MKIWWYIKCVFGFGSINEGSICWFSKRYYDAHDYPVSKGGNGDPCPFKSYYCPECGKKFTI